MLVVVRAAIDVSFERSRSALKVVTGRAAAQDKKWNGAQAQLRVKCPHGRESRRP